MALSLACGLLFVFYLCVVSLGAPAGENSRNGPRSVEVEEFPVRMPNVRPLTKDTYLCSAHRLPHSAADQTEKQYIVEVVPQASEATAHHMLLFGCRLPYEDKFWDCSDMGGICSRGSSRILFGWAKNAPGIAMPPGVGFPVQGNTGIDYVVLQIHYGHVDAFKKGGTDNSGLTLHLTTESMPRLAAIYLLLGARARIAAHTERTITDIACTHFGPPMQPFAFRVHAHSLGKTIMAYRVRGRQWTKIAAGSPQNPQAFYPLKDAPVIEEGDVIAARCEFDASGRDVDTHFGSHASDEMCNFYLMFSSPASQVTHSLGGECSHSGTIEWSHFKEPPSIQYDDVLSTRLPATTLRTQESRNHNTGLLSSSSVSSVRPSEVDIDWHPSHDATDETSIEEFDDTEAVDGSHLNDIKEEDDDFDVDDGQDNVRSHLIMQQWPVGGDKAGQIRVSSGLLGQVSGVDVNGSGMVYVFHRGPRVWNSMSFNYNNVYKNRADGPISVPTVVVLDAQDGSVIDEWGQDRFYMPHGLTVDGQGNVWLTDVALHQVFKFAANGGDHPLLELGQAFVPGHDHLHFCKPADIAVLHTGSFLVADGYCNQRIIRFHSDGRYDTEWTARGLDNNLAHVSLFGSQSFRVPHSLTLSELYNVLCVADRENGRIMCYHYDTGEFLTQFDSKFGGRVFAIAFNTDASGLLVVNGANEENVEVQGFSLNMDQDITDTWNSKPKGFTQPHDIAVGVDGSVFVAEIGPNRLWKFTPVSGSPSSVAATDSTQRLSEDGEQLLVTSPQPAVVTPSQSEAGVTTISTTELVTPSVERVELPHVSGSNHPTSSLPATLAVENNGIVTSSALPLVNKSSTAVTNTEISAASGHVALNSTKSIIGNNQQVLNENLATNSTTSSSPGFHASLLPIILVACLVAVPAMLLLALGLSRHGPCSKRSKRHSIQTKRSHRQYQLIQHAQEDVNSDSE